MNKKTNYLIDKIFQKLNKNKINKINLKKDELKKFIFNLISSN